ncbi:MAG: amino acid transporter [Actinomycetota bacterium]
MAPLFRPATFPWAIGGGWAIDLWCGPWARREHADTDVVVWGDDAAAVAEFLLPSWEIHLVKGGEFTPWAGVLGDAHQAWVQRAGDKEWAFELLFEQREGGAWVYRRDQRVRRPASGLIRSVRDLPVIELPVVLLYKAKDPGPTDHDDLTAALPLLDARDRTWLAGSIRTSHGSDHPWLGRLRGD